MTARKCTTIPRSFSWIIPAQSLVTGVAIYSTVFVFHVGSKPFVFAVIAAGLQFLLGLYCCITANRPGIHHAVVIPIWLAGIAGVWCAPVYYFSKAVSLWLKLLGPGSEGETPPAAKWSYVGLAMTCLDVIIPLTLLAIFLIEGLRNPHKDTVPYMTGFQAPAPEYSQPSTEAHHQSHHPPQQAYMYPQQLFAQTQQPHDNKYNPFVPTITPLTNPPSSFTNRIEAIRRICALQYPDGHWDATPELASLTRHWGGRHWIGDGGHSQVSQVAHATLQGLCQYVWTAQWERKENERLSAAEMASFQAVSWDLGFAKTALAKGTSFLSGGVNER